MSGQNVSFRHLTEKTRVYSLSSMVYNCGANDFTQTALHKITLDIDMIDNDWSRQEIKCRIEPFCTEISRMWMTTRL
jgi:GH24 family phage-related lysozyme (muramidase)